MKLLFILHTYFSKAFPALHKKGLSFELKPFCLHLSFFIYPKEIVMYVAKALAWRMFLIVLFIQMCDNGTSGNKRVIGLCILSKMERKCLRT